MGRKKLDLKMRHGIYYYRLNKWEKCTKTEHYFRPIRRYCPVGRKKLDLKMRHDILLIQIKQIGGNKQ